MRKDKSVSNFHVFNIWNLSNLFVFDKIFGFGITMFDETNFLSI